MSHHVRLGSHLTLVRGHGGHKRRDRHAAAHHLHKAVREHGAGPSIRQFLADVPFVCRMSDADVVRVISEMIETGRLHLVHEDLHRISGVTGSQLQKIFTAAPSDYLAQVAEELNLDAAQHGLDTLLRRAHFLAQVREEAGPMLTARVENLNYSPDSLKAQFKYFREHPDEAKADGYVRDAKTRKITQAADQKAIANHAYANRKDLGNGDFDSGDGWNYRGRGFIQVTGRANYEAVSKQYKQLYSQPVDFVANPDLMAQFPFTVRSAICFWVSNRLPLLADRGANAADVDRITRVVNRHTPSYQARESNFKTVYAALMGLAVVVFSAAALGVPRAAAAPPCAAPPL